MIRSISIENYRLFSKLHVAELGQLNLLVGRNNSGKSAFLEAVRLLWTRGSNRTLSAIAMGRGDALESRIRPLDGFEENLFRWGTELEVGFRISDSERAVRVRVRRYRVILHEGEPIGSEPLGPDADPDEGELEYEVESEGVNRRIRRLRMEPPGFRTLALEEDCIFLGTQGLSPREISELWPRVALTDTEEHLNQLLASSFPEIERVTVVPMGNAGKVLTKVKGNATPVSIRNLGEGASRLLGLALAVACAKDGVLLIDEAEIGLHYSLQLDVWRFLARSARALNVQVFATTHSSDTVRAFSKACLENEDVVGRLISLRKWRGEIVAAEYSEEEQQLADETGKELR